MAEGEAHLEELRVSDRSCDGDDLKQDIQETIQTADERPRDLLQSAQPHHR